MKLKLEMTFDIPEELYRDDEEDKDIPTDELEQHWLGFAREELYSNFVNFALCKHIESVLEELADKNRSYIKKSHNKWAKIIEDAQHTAKYTIS